MGETVLHDILKEKIYVFKKVIYFPPEPVREFFFFLILGKEN